MKTFQSLIMSFSTSVTKILKRNSLQNKTQKSIIKKNEKQRGGFVNDNCKKIGKILKLGIINLSRTR